MKRFLSNLRMVLPKDMGLLPFTFGVIAGYLILQITIILTHSRIISDDDYVNFYMYQINVENLLDKVAKEQTDYFIDLMQTDEYQDYQNSFNNLKDKK